MDYPIQSIYSNAPREQVETALGQYHLPVEFVTIPYTYPWVNTGQHRVLVGIMGLGIWAGTGNLVHSQAHIFGGI